MMMRLHKRKSQAGFTLIELVLVLAITGIIVAGLWRLISGGNAQLRDQAAATMQSQFISATKAYLSSQAGQTYLIGSNDGLPHNLAVASLASYLPAGFTAATNSYNQGFTIQVIGDGSGVGNVPNSYSFMILTSGGTIIPDVSGGRITAMIGSDGGFIYSNNTCTAGNPTHTACGAFGAWQVDLATYGLNVPYPATGGYIASRSYISPEQDSSLPWLARTLLNGNLAYNTMSTDLYMSSQKNINMSNNPAALGGSINMGVAGGSSMGGALNMEGGAINAQSGTINMQNGVIDLAAGNITGTSNVGSILINAASNSPVVVTTPGCNMVTPNQCTYGMTVPSINVSNLINTSALYAGNFIYNLSDIRLKTNIRPIANSLDDLMRLKPVTFTFKSNNKSSLGFIAQDVEKIYPQLVTPAADGMKAVSYDGLIAPLVDSVQELKRENDELRHEIATQKAREDRLEAELRKEKAPAP